MVDHILSVEFQDGGMAAKADAAAKAIDGIGASAEGMQSKVIASTRSSTAAVRKWADETDKAVQQTVKAERELSNMLVSVAADQAKGKGNVDEQARSVANLTAHVEKLRQRSEALVATRTALSAGGVTAALDAEAAAMARTATSLDQLRAKHDPMFRTTQAYITAIGELNTLIDSNGNHSKFAAMALGQLTEAYAKANPAAQQAIANAKAETEALLGLTVAARNAATVSRLRENSGPPTAATLLGLPPSAAGGAAASAAAFTAGLDQQRSSLDSVFRASKAYEAQLATIDAAEQRLAFSAGVATRLRNEATESFARANDPLNSATKAVKAHSDAAVRTTATTGELTFATRQFGVQSMQAFSGIATGQPILMTFIQQGHQMVDVALATGTGFGVVGYALKALAGFLVSTTGSLIAAGAALGYITYSAESTNRQFGEMSTRLRATRDDYVSLAKEATRAGKAIAGEGLIGGADAQTAARRIASVPEFAGTKTDLQDLIRLSIDVAAAFDEGIDPAAGRVAAALKSPKDAAQAFMDQGLRGMNQALLDSVTRMQDSGRFAEAQAVTLRALAASTKDAALPTTALGKALEDLSGAFNKTGADGKSFGQSLGESLAADVAVLVSVLAGAVRALKEVRDVMSSAQSASGWLGSGIGNALRNSPITALTARMLGIGGTPGITTSSAGAQGMFQLMPDTAKGLGITPETAATPEGNVYGGLTYIAKLRSMAHIGDNEDAVAAAYNAGPERYRQFVQNGRALPDETVKHVAKVAAARASSLPADANALIEGSPLAGGFDAKWLDFAKRLALVESGGRQFGGTATTRPGWVDGATGSRPYGADQGQVDRAMKLAGQIGSSDVTLTGLDKVNAQIEQLTKARDIVGERLKAEGGANKDTVKEWETLSGALNKVTGDHYTTGDAIQQLTRRLAEGLGPLGEADGAARTLAEAQNDLTNASLAAGRIPTSKERSDVEAVAMMKLSVAFRDQVAEIDRSIAGQRAVAAAYSISAEAGQRATEGMKAQEAARKIARVGTIEYAAALAILTQKRIDEARAAVDADTAVKNLQTKDEIEYLKKEGELIGANADVRERELAILRERQRLVGQKADLTSTASQESLRLAAEKAQTGFDVSHQKQVFDELANFGTQAFDKIGTAITEAFATGNLKALNFGKIAKAVMSEVIQYVLKIAVLNPILNSLFGGTRSTLTDNVGVLGKMLGGGAGGGGFSLSSLVGGIGGGSWGGSGGASSISTSLFGTASGGESFSDLGGVTQGTSGMLGSGGIENVLGSGLSSLIPSMGTLGGIGAGFGLGSLVSGLVAKSAAQRQNGMIGSALGAILGGPLGGIIGGGLGGLIGPKDSVKSFGYRLQSSGFQENGANAMGGALLPVDRKYYNESGSAQFAQADALIVKVNEFLAANKLQVGGAAIIEGNKNGPGGSTPGSVGTLAEAFARLRFASTDSSALTNSLAGKTFDDPAKLEEWVTGFKQAEAIIDTMGKDALPAFEQQMKGINDSFDTATETVRKYGLAETGLEEQRAKQIAALNAAAVKARRDIGVALDARDLASSGRTQEAALVRFDADASKQFDDLITTFKAWYGEAYASDSGYQTTLNTLTRVLAQERAAVIAPNIDPARGQVTGTLDSLRQFAISLQTGSASALTPQQQYAAAADHFAAVGQSALGGDFKALQDSQGYASAFLNTSRVVNGSGEQYAADYDRVIRFLQSVAGASTDALTASAMAQIQETASEKMAASVAALGVAVAGATTDAVSGTSTAFQGYATAAQVAINAAAVKVANDNADIYARVYADGVTQFIATVSASNVRPNGLTQTQFEESAQHQTDQLVAKLETVRLEVQRLKEEVQHQSSAPAGFGGGGRVEQGANG